MRRNEDEASINKKILDAAKAEFMQKGFMEASMRLIAERAGYTTGILYSHFADKDSLFRALVDGGGNELYSYFIDAQEYFAELPSETQYTDMHSYTERKVDRMVDIVYDNFDTFKLIICCSAGSSYEHYVDKLVEIEMFHTRRYIQLLKDMGHPPRRELREDLSHMISSALFNGMFEAVAHDLTREEAKDYIFQLRLFFNAGWDCILGLPDNWLDEHR